MVNIQRGTFSGGALHFSGGARPQNAPLGYGPDFPFQAQNTPLQNCIPSLGSFPISLDCLPDFDSCYSHFMPYRMTPSVRHRAIEVYYYYYYSRGAEAYYRPADNYQINSLTYIKPVLYRSVN